MKKNKVVFNVLLLIAIIASFFIPLYFLVDGYTVSLYSLFTYGGIYTVIEIIVIIIALSVPILAFIGIGKNKTSLQIASSIIALILGFAALVAAVVAIIKYMGYSEYGHYVALGEVIFVIIYAFAFPLLVVNIKQAKANGEKSGKKPSKFKLMATATKRINSLNYCGIFYGLYGPGNEEARFVNLTKEGGGIVIYSTKYEDTTLYASDIKNISFKEKGAWYTNGTNEIIDISLSIECRDGKVGVFKGPIAKFRKNYEPVPKITQDNINKMLRILGSDLKLSYSLYSYEVLLKNKKTIKGFIVSESDEGFLKELKENYPTGGLVLNPEHLRNKTF